MEEVKNSPYYYLSKKRKVNRDYWYAYFPDDENPGKVKVKSVESLRKLLGIKDRTKITRKQEAAIITQKALDAGVVRFGEKDPLFVDYVAEFWDFEQSAYIKRKNFKQAGSISRDYARNILGTFKKNAVPLLPMGLKLSQITTAHIENLIDHWINDGELSQSTIARVLQSMAVPLKEATRLGKIHHNPMLAVDTVSAKPKERGILTDSEIVQLFSLMQERVQQGTLDKAVFLASLLSTYTGMRQGEIRALEADAIQLVNDEHGIIHVQAAWANYGYRKSPKGKRDRKVPAPRWLCDELLKLAEMNPYENSLVFWSKKSAAVPLAATYFRNWLYDSLTDLFELNAGSEGQMVPDGEKVDTDGNPVMIRAGEETRRVRNVNFHSFRHFFVTQMRGKLSESDLRNVVGHQDSKTTDLYDHFTDESLLRIGKVSSNIIQFQRVEDADKLKEGQG
jgi:integrase